MLPKKDIAEKYFPEPYTGPAGSAPVPIAGIVKNDHGLQTSKNKHESLTKYEFLQLPPVIPSFSQLIQVTPGSLDNPKRTEDPFCTDLQRFNFKVGVFFLTVFSQMIVFRGFSFPGEFTVRQTSKDLQLIFF